MRGQLCAGRETPTPTRAFLYFFLSSSLCASLMQNDTPSLLSHRLSFLCFCQRVVWSALLFILFSLSLKVVFALSQSSGSPPPTHCSLSRPGLVCWSFPEVSFSAAVVLLLPASSLLTRSLPSWRSAPPCPVNAGGGRKLKMTKAIIVLNLRTRPN